MSALTGIEHVVVLMLENRSFDSILGRLYPASAGFAGLTGRESNSWLGPDGTRQEIAAWNDAGLSAATATIPDPDPGELFADIDVQLFGAGAAPSREPPPMSGFVSNYMAQPGARDPRAPMHGFTARQVPVLSALARAFGCSDQYFASAPCQTWPNRFFAHAGTCEGHVDNDRFPIPFTGRTIFHRLSAAGRSWRVYFHDVPQAATIGDLWLEAALRFKDFAEFLEDAKNGALPHYSFIEPRYFTDGILRRIPNDQHPPHNVAYGEQLIAAVYNAVRAAPTWKQTLLLVTYDEHGGCYDHVPPPLAVPPDALAPDGFTFDRYGVRVPAVIVSPYMPPGSIVRARETGLPHRGPPYPFDHCSILATLRKLYELGDPLTARDAVAPDLLGPLSLEAPENDGPASVSPANAQPSEAEVATRAAAPPNLMQRNLWRLSAQLPARDAAAAPSAPAPPATAGAAHEFATSRVKAFLGK